MPKMLKVMLINMDFKSRQIISPSQQMLKISFVLLAFLVFMGNCSEEESKITVGSEPQTFDYKAAHKLFMLYGWTILADLIILLAFYQHRRYTKIIHAVLGMALIGTTLYTSLPSLIKNGINRKHHLHYLTGVVIYGVMGLQLILGVAKFGLVYFNKGNSLVIYIIKSIHKYIGYGLALLCKTQILFILSPTRSEYSILIGWEIAIIIIFFYRLLTFPKLTSAIMPDLNVGKRITKLSEVQSSRGFIIFGNYVYDLQPLKIGHPAGFKIVQAIKNQSADKYMYGMYSSEVETRVPRYSHSVASLKVLGKPEARIDIPSTYRGFEKEVVKVKATSINQISKHVFQVKLVKDEGFNFSFKGYSDENQIGRYYSLTFDYITRLYTSVNFLTKKNKDLLKAAYFGPNNIDIEYELTDKSNKILINDNLVSNEEDQLPLLIKQYRKGNFTKKLHQLKEKKLQLSVEKGFGLSISNLDPGKVVVLVGGTGIFPFCDLIDLLFKDCLRKKVEAYMTARIISQNPLLNKNPFDKLTFQFLGSFHCLNDIPKITLHQVLYLCKHRVGFSFLFRIKKKIPQERVSELGINLTKERFEQLIADVIMKGNLSKVFVCGPPGMNSSIRKLIEKMLTRSQFQIM